MSLCGGNTLPRRFKTSQILLETDSLRVETFLQFSNTTQEWLAKQKQTLSSPTVQKRVHGRVTRTGWCVLTDGSALLLFSLKDPSLIFELNVPESGGLEAVDSIASSLFERMCLVTASSQGVKEGSVTAVVVVTLTGTLCFYTDPVNSDGRFIRHNLSLETGEQPTSLARISASLLFVVGTSKGRLIAVDFTSDPSSGSTEDSILQPTSNPASLELTKSSSYTGFGLGSAVGWLFGSADTSSAGATGGVIRAIVSLNVGERQRGICTLSDENLSIWMGPISSMQLEVCPNSVYVSCASHMTHSFIMYHSFFFFFVLHFPYLAFGTSYQVPSLSVSS